MKRPKFGETYWYWHKADMLDDKEYPVESIWSNYLDECQRLEEGNCYKTLEECLKMKGKRIK